MEKILWTTLQKQIIKIVFSCNDEDRAFRCANEIADRLRAQIDKLNISEYLEVNGAMKCIMQKINAEYRFQIIIKNKIA